MEIGELREALSYDEGLGITLTVIGEFFTLIAPLLSPLTELLL